MSENTGGLIEHTSENTLKSIENISVKNIPDRPTARGMTAAEIKKAIYAPSIDASYSVIAELRRVINRLNEIFSKVNTEDKLVEANGSYPVTAAVLIAVKNELESILSEKYDTAEVAARKVAAAISGLIGGAGDGYDTLKELEELLKGLDAAVLNKLDKTPFTADDFGKFVVVGGDGGLEAVTVPIGGEFGD